MTNDKGLRKACDDFDVWLEASMHLPVWPLFRDHMVSRLNEFLQRPIGAPMNQKWEYCTGEFGVEALNALGRDGWEVIGVTVDRYQRDDSHFCDKVVLLKRRIE